MFFLFQEINKLQQFWNGNHFEIFWILMHPFGWWPMLMWSLIEIKLPISKKSRNRTFSWFNNKYSMQEKKPFYHLKSLYMHYSKIWLLISYLNLLWKANRSIFPKSYNYVFIQEVCMNHTSQTITIVVLIL